MSALAQIPAFIHNFGADELRQHDEVTSSLLPAIKEYLNRSGSEIMADRTHLPSALTMLALLFGPTSAHETLTNLRRKGVSDDLAAVCSVQIMRRIGNFDKAPHYLQQIYFGGNESFYVGQFLADSYAAIGDVHSLQTFSDAIVSDTTKTLKANDRDLQRWATLLLDFALVDSAGNFVGNLKNTATRSFLESRLKSFNSTLSHLPIYVINLDSEERKWKTASTSLTRAGYRNLIRHSAVYGKALSRSAIDSLVRDETAKAELRTGAVACWLSHNKAWELIADGSDDYAVILEDDALAFTGADYLDSWIGILSQYDLVWINRRMSGIAHTEVPKWYRGLVDPWEQLSTWPDRRQGWGADGYLISKKGAKKLLEMSTTVGITNHVDGQLGALTLSPETEPISSAQRRLLGMREKMNYELDLKSISLQIPAIRERPFGVSSTANIHRS